MSSTAGASSILRLGSTGHKNPPIPRIEGTCRDGGSSTPPERFLLAGLDRESYVPEFLGEKVANGQR